MRLLGQHLTRNDVVKIEVFLRVGQHKLRCDWSLVSEGEVDVLLVSGDRSDTVPGLLNNPRATLHLLDASATADLRSRLPAALVRPLEYEAFIDELSRLERAFADGQGPAAPPANRPLEPVPPRVQPEPEPARVKPVPPEAASAAPPALVAGAVYRLRRWPSTEVLRGHRYFVRLASFLSTRHVDLAELARLSNVGVAECQEFVLKLLAVDLLDVRQQAAASLSGGSAAARKPALAAPGKRLPEPGLFKRIRLSLGMGGAR
jgi:hypothetical protein